MKKIIFVLAAMLLLMGTTFAQEKSKSSRADLLSRLKNAPSVVRAAQDAQNVTHFLNTSSINVIFSEGFETAALFELPDGWTKDVPGMDEPWFVYDNDDDYYTSHSGLQYVMNVWDYEYDRNAWMFSPGFALIQNITYDISFWVIMGWNDDDGDCLTVKIAQTPSIAGMNSGTTVYATINGYYEDWTQITYSFTPTVAGTYYLGFRACNDIGDGYDIVIDDILITADILPTECNPAANLTVNYTTDCKAELAWTASADAISYDVSRNGTFLANVTGVSYTDDNFPSTQNTWTVVAVCAEGESTPISETKAACTIEVPECEPVTGFVVNYTADCKAELTWTASANAISYSIYRNDEWIHGVGGTSYTDEGFSTTQPHTWTVIAICGAEDESTPVSVTKEACFVGINENAKTGFSILPNPATNEIKVSSLSSFHTIEVVSFLGQTVLSQSNVGNTISLDVSNLTDGVYFVRIISDNGTSVKKFVKQ